MRVAMGLAFEEIDGKARAIEFYDLLSSFDYMSSTPTLFNSGTLRPQLSSCYLTTVPDDLDGIYGAIKDNALLSKWAGGLGNDWTRVRGLGAYIKGTNGKSQGVVPFLKVANDTAVAVNQGGKRKGAVCAYLETWHLDIEEFLDLRKNTGDDRRRTHDMNTANWVPDLFMKRVVEDGDVDAVLADDAPDLHDLTGAAFERELRRNTRTCATRRDASCQARPRAGPVAQDAVDAVRDRPSLDHLQGPLQPALAAAARRRGAQLEPLHRDHAQHSAARSPSATWARSTSRSTSSKDGARPRRSWRSTVTTAMRMLDNVIDINYYTVPQARASNLRHRPVGLGIMGFQDALYNLRCLRLGRGRRVRRPIMEAISYFAIQASTDLAEERGSYSSYEGSLWSQGMLPIDSLDLLERERGEQYSKLNTLDAGLGHAAPQVKTVGMRNSNVMAIAPTATISNIGGVSQSIEPTYQNLYVKSNLSGEFTVVNPYLVHDLKKLGLWDEVMINDLKYFDGSVQKIDRMPEELKRCTPPPSRSSRAGWSKPAPPAEVDRSGAVAEPLHRRPRARSWT